MLHLFASALLVAIAGATTFDACKNGRSPIAVRFNECDVPPCKFYSGQLVVAEVDFAIEHPVDKMATDVQVRVGDMTVTYPLPEPDACKCLTNSECPLAAGEKVTVHMELPINEAFPKIKFTMQLSQLDQNNSTLQCFQITGEVVG